MLRFLTAGESHGKCLMSILEGLPSGLGIKKEFINNELARRQRGYGRGGRMKIENDSVSILSGVRWGKTTGSPMSLEIKNRDWINNHALMSIESADQNKSLYITKPRPGHADLPGMLKYDMEDLRNIKERASARETASRVAVGSVCKLFLMEFGIKIFSYVKEIGGIKASITDSDLEKNYSKIENSPVRCLDQVAQKKMIDEIDKAVKNGNTLGGTFKVIVKNVIPGLGSHIQWDKRLDSFLSAAVMSVPAIKGVEIGAGFALSGMTGSKAQDEIFYNPKEQRFYRKTNFAGGLEGGITNGEDIVISAVMKPIPTLMNPLSSIDVKTKKTVKAEIIRSDACAVPACSVVAEAMVAYVLANAIMEKFGGDSIREVTVNYKNYIKQTKNF